MADYKEEKCKHDKLVGCVDCFYEDPFVIAVNSLAGVNTID